MKPLFRFACLFTLCLSSTSAWGQVPKLIEGRTVSSIDGTEQPFRYWLPAATANGRRPLLVSLHSWSADYTQDRSEWVQQAVQRNWIYLQPNFRGMNQTRQACGSLRARWDILDAIDWMIEHQQIDESRLYLCGVSGGGHMTMLMSAYHPERFSAASAWVGISNLNDWYNFHTKEGIEGKYSQMISASCGGSPGTSAAIDTEYVRRSAIHFLQHAHELPLDLNTGVRDGKAGSVPIHQTLRAYNVVVKPRGGTPISEAEMDDLWDNEHLAQPTAEDSAGDATYSRKVLLRRQHGPTRVTVFDGGHEALPDAACTWLEQQNRPTKKPVPEMIP